MSTWILNLQLRLLFFSLSLSARGFNATRWDLNAFCVFSSAFSSNNNKSNTKSQVARLGVLQNECRMNERGVLIRITEVNETVENCSAHSIAANVLTYENTY